MTAPTCKEKQHMTSLMKAVGFSGLEIHDHINSDDFWAGAQIAQKAIDKFKHAMKKVK